MGNSEKDIMRQTDNEGQEGLEELKKLRAKIDHFDQELMQVFGKRFQVSRKIALLKQNISLPRFDPKREEEMFSRRCEWGTDLNVPDSFTKDLFSLILEASKIDQEKNEQLHSGK